MCAAHAECGYPHTHSAAAASWLAFGEEGNGSPGDIAVFVRPGGHHVAFISEFYKVGNHHIICLGGNQGDQIRYGVFIPQHLVAIRKVRAPAEAVLRAR